MAIRTHLPARPGLAVAVLAFAHAHARAAIDLSSYVRVGRYDLPEPTRTQAPAGNVLAQEASGVTYDRDTGTLFVVGDGGTSVTQVTKTGQLVNTMTLQAGEFNDTEGVTYTGGGKFVFTEESLRQLVQFTYAGGGTLTRAAAPTVKLGTTVGRRRAGSSSSRRRSRSASSRPASTSPPAPRPTAARRPRARSTCSTRRSPACRISRTSTRSPTAAC